MILRATLSLFLVASCVAGVAQAETESVRLEYAAPGECPGQQEFEAEVRARTAKVVFGGEGRRFVVQVGETDTGFEGRLAIVELDGKENERKLDGTSCVDVVSSLALVAALAIDPDASTAPREELPPAKSVEAPEPTPPPSVEPKVAPASQPLARRRPSEPRNERVQVALGASFAVVQGPAPVLLLSAGPEAEVARSFGWTRSSLRLGVLAADTKIVGFEDEQSEFRWVVARPSICPLGRDRGIRFLLCVLADLGFVRAEGKAVDVPKSATRFWAALGPAGRVGVSTSRIYVDFDMALLVPLTRDDFIFENPRIVVHDVPAFGWSTGLSAGVKLP